MQRLLITDSVTECCWQNGSVAGVWLFNI